MSRVAQFLECLLAIFPSQSKCSHIGDTETGNHFPQGWHCALLKLPFHHRDFRPIHQLAQSDRIVEERGDFFSHQFLGNHHGKIPTLSGGPYPPGIFHEPQRICLCRRKFPAKNARSPPWHPLLLNIALATQFYLGHPPNTIDHRLAIAFNCQTSTHFGVVSPYILPTSSILIRPTKIHFLRQSQRPQ